MSNLLDILQETADPNPAKIAKILGCPLEKVEAELRALRDDGSYLVGCLCFILPKKAVKPFVQLLK